MIIDKSAGIDTFVSLRNMSMAKPPETTSIEAAGNRLRNAGYRVTRQRLSVYAYLQTSQSHPTVDDIYTGVRSEYPNISPATVYRSVGSLVDVGLVKPINLGHAATRYDASPDEHAHFRCIACNGITDVHVKDTPDATDQLKRFEMIGSSVEFYGFCSACNRDRSTNSATHAESN